MGIVAALLGDFGPRFWWKGLALVVLAALVGAACKTAFAILTNPDIRANGYTLTPGSIAYGSAVSLASALIWYAAGAFAAFVIRKLIASRSTRLP